MIQSDDNVIEARKMDAIKGWMSHPGDAKRDPADILFFNIASKDLNISIVVRFQGKLRARISELKGIVYSDGKHYTSRVVDSSLDVWFHDGMTTAELAQKMGFLVK